MVHTPLWKSFLDHGAPTDPVARAHRLHAWGMPKARRGPDMILRLAVAPEILTPMWPPTKSKPNEGVLMVPGNQISPHHRVHLGIHLRRRMGLSSESQLMNIVRVLSLKLRMLYPLTYRTPFVHLQAKSDHYHCRRVYTKNQLTPMSHLQRRKGGPVVA